MHYYLILTNSTHFPKTNKMQVLSSIVSQNFTQDRLQRIPMDLNPLSSLLYFYPLYRLFRIISFESTIMGRRRHAGHVFAKVCAANTKATWQTGSIPLSRWKKKPANDISQRVLWLAVQPFRFPSFLPLLVSLPPPSSALIISGAQRQPCVVKGARRDRLGTLTGWRNRKVLSLFDPDVRAESFEEAHALSEGLSFDLYCRSP